MRILKYLKRYAGYRGIALVLAVVLLFEASPSVTLNNKQVTITFGPPEAYAAGTADYSLGTNGATNANNISTALNALPTQGGLFHFKVGTYNITQNSSGPLTRVFGNMTIEGEGKGTFFTGNGSWLAGGSNWVFRNLAVNQTSMLPNNATWEKVYTPEYPNGISRDTDGVYSVLTQNATYAFITSGNFTSANISTLNVTSINGSTINGTQITGTTGNLTTAYVTSLNMSGDILPTSNNTRSLGTTLFRWLTGWFVNLVAETVNATQLTATTGNFTILNTVLYGDIDNYLTSHNLSQTISHNLSGLLALKAPLASPTFAGTVTLPAVTLGGDVTFVGAQVVYTGGQPFRISTTMNSTDGLNVNSINAVAYGPRLIFDHGRTTPFSQVNDIPGSIGFRARDNDGTQVDIGAIDMQITAVGATYVDAMYIFYSYILGVETNALQLSNTGLLQLRDTGGLNTGLVDDDYYTLGAVDNDTNNITEVARVTGAATPTFDLVLGRLTGALNANTQAINTVNGITLVSETGVMTAATGWNGIGTGVINSATDAYIEIFGITGGIGADGQIRIKGGTVSSPSGAHGEIEFYTGANIQRLGISRDGVALWTNITHTTIVITNESSINAANGADGDYFTIGARNSITDAIVEVARVFGANTPYFQLTLPPKFASNNATPNTTDNTTPNTWLPIVLSDNTTGYIKVFK